MRDGIILINKPEGMTSFAVVATLKRRFGIKCGHSGTLDPLATGLLPIMCGKATKLCAYLTEKDKAYRAKFRFGIQTDTYDITGNVIKTSEKEVTLSQIKEVIKKFCGKITQTPPVYSAIKVGGQPLYKLARQGKEVTVPEREIEIYSIDIIDFDGTELTVDVTCSKGTYIRSLCNDIAKELGTVATMSALVRTKSSKWDLKDAFELDLQDLEEHIIPMDTVLDEFPAFYPGSFFAKLLENGCAIDIKKLKNIPCGISRVYSEHKLLGLGQVNEQNQTYKIITHL